LNVQVAVNVTGVSSFPGLQAVNDSMLPSVCYMIFIPTLTPP